MTLICLDDLYAFARTDVEKSPDLDYVLAELILRRARISSSFTEIKNKLIKDIPRKEGGWYIFLSNERVPIYVGTSFEGKTYSLYERLAETLNDERWLFYWQYIRQDVSLEDFTDILRRHSAKKMTDTHIKKKYHHYRRCMSKKASRFIDYITIEKGPQGKSFYQMVEACLIGSLLPTGNLGNFQRAYTDVHEIFAKVQQAFLKNGVVVGSTILEISRNPKYE